MWASSHSYRSIMNSRWCFSSVLNSVSGKNAMMSPFENGTAGVR